MGKPDAPAPPDPVETASAQTGTNVGTAIANSVLGMVDQTTPYGTLNYNQVGGEGTDVPGIVEIPGVTAPGTPAGFGATGTGGGENSVGTVQTTSPSQFQVGEQVFSSRDAAEAYRNNLLAESSGGYVYNDPYTGESYVIPRFESTVELNPQQQATLDASQQAQTNLADLASDRSDFLLGYLPETESLTNEIGNRLYDMGSERLDPRFDREMETLRTRLANQGIMPGSTAYDREMSRFAEGKNDAYNQLLLQGRGQALNEINTPINQITALLSGSQVTNPNVSLASPAQIPTTDVAGIINTNYNQQLGAYNQELSNRNSMMGGLFGAGATLLGAPAGSVFGGLF